MDIHDDVLQSCGMDLVKGPAVVTGAASGIGLATAGLLVKNGIDVVLVDCNPDISGVRDRLAIQAKRPVKLLAFCGDATDEIFIKTVFAESTAAIGVPRICLAIAGITRDSLALKKDKQTGEFVQYPREKFLQVLQINLIAPFYWMAQMAQGILEDREAKKLGRWRQEDINEPFQGIGIFAGSIMKVGNAGQVSYSASKAGLSGICGTLNQELLSQYGIRFAMVNFTFINTPMVQAIGAKNPDVFQKGVIDRLPLHKIPGPDEAAKMIFRTLQSEHIIDEVTYGGGWNPTYMR